jgi:hypothetical protein
MRTVSRHRRDARLYVRQPVNHQERIATQQPLDIFGAQRRRSPSASLFIFHRGPFARPASLASATLSRFTASLAAPECRQLHLLPDPWRLCQGRNANGRRWSHDCDADLAAQQYEIAEVTLPEMPTWPAITQ